MPRPDRRIILAPAAIFLLALALRLLYLAEIRDIGFWSQPLSDARIYVERAAGIAAGDWLGPADFVHAPLYAYVLALIRVLAGALGADPADLLWPRIVQAVLGSLACVILYFAARRWFASTRNPNPQSPIPSPPLPLLSALLLALHPPAIFFDGLIQKTSIENFLACALLWLLAAARDAQRAGPALPRAAILWSLTGITFALFCLSRQTALALLPIPLAMIWFCRRSSPVTDGGGGGGAVSEANDGGGRSTPLRQPPNANAPAVSIRTADPRSPIPSSLLLSALFLLFLSLTFAPWVARNRAVLGEFMLSTPNLGQNFFMGAQPSATGTYLPFARGKANAEYEQDAWVRYAEQSAGRDLTAREVSSFYLDRALDWIYNHPGEWAALTLKKLAMTIGACEIPDTEDYYLYRERSFILRILDPVLHFGVLFPLGVMGIVLTARAPAARASPRIPPSPGRRSLWPLYLWLLLNVLAVAAFVVFARYRFPIVPVLCLFAAAPVAALASFLAPTPSPHGHAGEVSRTGRAAARGALLWPVACGLVALLLSNFPFFSSRAPRPFSFANHAVALADAGRPDEALAEVDRAIALSNSPDPETLTTRASILIDLARYAEALADLDRAIALDPSFAAAHRARGVALLRSGNLDAADEALRRAITLDRFDHVAMTLLAEVVAQRGQFNDAFILLKRAIELRPRYAEAHLNLGNIYMAANDPASAVTPYKDAIALRPDYADAWFNLGLAQANSNQLSAAAESFRKVLELDPRREDARRALEALNASRP